MRLPKIEIIPRRAQLPTVLADGQVQRPWAYAIRRTWGSDVDDWRDSLDAGRLVYLVGGRWVLKVDQPGKYLGLQAAREIQIWGRLDAADRPHFCTLLAWQTPKKKHRGWVLMPRLRFRPGRRPLWAWQVVLRLMRKYKLRDFIGSSGSVGTTNNWCMVTRRGRAVPVIYDYGY